ncbi:MAG: TIM barrel protein [Armatimonadetes bacterium]|nr:TIM barrel protein [Armatimonadota bacterium]
MSIRIGAQLNCWPLGTLGEELVIAVREAGEIGFQGIETNWRMINQWGDRRREFADLLRQSGVVLSALFFGAGSAESTAARQEIDDALRAAEFLRAMGSDRMMVGGGKATDDPDEFRTVCDHYSELGARVLDDFGVKACYHLHHGAIASSPDEIARMMELTDKRTWFLCPDSGIMVREGHDLNATLSRYFDRIGYVHFKDWDGGESWCMLGEGVVDHTGALQTLEALGYDGWVISENESRRQDLSPKEQQAADRAWFRAQGY